MRIREFNMAMLGKWYWCMLHEWEGLWLKVLAARYGVVWGRLQEGGRRGSSWWKEVRLIRDGGGAQVGGWFDENIRRIVGKDSFFWTGRWGGGCCFFCQVSSSF